MRTELGKQVEVEVDEARLSRGWEDVEARVFAPPPRRLGGLALPVGGALALAAAVALVFFGGAGGEEPPTALVAEGGTVAERLAAAGDAGGTVSFDDGSRITLSPSAELEPLTNSGSEFRMLLHRGRARFEVTPGGPRRWIIEAGHASVEVIGTVFTVERRDADVDVEVERGRVMVRSERLTEGLRVLGASERVSVLGPGTEHASSGGTDPSAVAEGSAAIAAGDVPPPAPEGLAHDSTDPVELLAPNAREGASSPPPRERLERAPSAATLLAEADEARRAGRNEDALALLARASAMTGASEAPLASLTRARLLSTLGRDGEAAIDLRRALDGRLPSTLEESARYRLVLALAASGDDAGAGRAREDYLRRYPEGSFRDALLERDPP